MNSHYFEQGSENDQTIIFLHGLGVSSWMWQEQIDSLKDDFHCLAIDLPGNGDSYQQPWHSLAGSADQVADIIRSKAHNGRAHIVSLSLGGYVTLHLLARHPELVLSAVVSGVTPEPLVRPGLVRPLSNLISFLMDFRIMAKLSARMMQLPEDVVPLYEKDMARLSKKTVNQIYEEVFEFYPPEIEPMTAERLLIVGGDKEAKAVVNGLETFAEQMPEITTAIAPNAHHGWNGEHPDLFTQMVFQWIKQEPLPDELIVQTGARLDPVITG